MNLQDIALLLGFVLVAALILSCILWPVRTNPYEEQLAEFDARIERARKSHQAIRHIQAERQAFVHSCLRGGKC